MTHRREGRQEDKSARMFSVVWFEPNAILISFFSADFMYFFICNTDNLMYTSSKKVAFQLLLLLLLRLL